MRMRLSLLQHQPINASCLASILSVIGVILAGHFCCSVAYASDIGLRVDPPVISLRAQTPFKQDIPLNIENIGTKPVSTTVQYLPFAPSKKNDGTIQYLPKGEMYLNADRTIFNSVTIIDDNQSISNIVIAPKQTKSLIARFNLSENTKPGDYYFSFVFVGENEQPEEAKSHTLLRAGIATHVLLTVLPKEQEKALLEEFRTQSFHKSSPIPFIIKAQNPSNNYITVSGTLTIMNLFGQTINRIDIQEQTVLAKSSRYIGLELLHDQEEITTPVVLAKENLFFGHYTAQLTLSSGGSQSIQKSVSFSIFPFHEVLIIIGVGIVAGFIIKRIRTKLTF